MNDDLSRVFNPQSIAIVGVSNDPRKLSSIFFTNLIDDGFKGKIYPVNPKYTELYGYKCYAKVSDIPDAVDQVAVLIPSDFVLDVVKDCAAKRVNNIIIISAGFGETSPEGKQLEKDIVRIANEAGIRVLGPNIIGVVNTHIKMNSSWMQLFPKEGNIAFLSQSGAFCTAILDTSLKRNLGFYNFCSVGNKADIDELDLISHWYKDSEASIIGAYLEEISHGYELMKFLNTSDKIKPVILLKPGKSQEAVKAIASHTGSLAGASETITAAINQCNIISADSSNELIDNLMTFSWSNNVKGNRVAVITNAGGPGIMATDAVIENRLEIAKLTEETIAELKKVLPEASNTHNPIDVLGDASADRYQHAADIVLKDPNVDVVLFILTPQYITEIEDTAKTIIRTKRFSEKPLFAVFLGQKYVDIGIERLCDAHVPAFNSIDSAARSIADLYVYSKFLAEKNLDTNKSLYSEFESNLFKGSFKDELESKLVENEVVRLSDDLTERISKEAGFDLPKQRLCLNIDDAKVFAEGIYPIVIKIPNEYLAHKTEEKAIVVNISTPQELEAAFNELTATLYRLNLSGKPLLIQEMIRSEQELFIGANRDGSMNVYSSGKTGFGHLLVYGQGGIYTEIYKDLAHTLIPATREQIIKDFNTTKLSKIVSGARGKAPLPIEKIIDSIQATQKLLNLYPQIISLDINPLLITTDRVVAVDIKVYVKA